MSLYQMTLSVGRQSLLEWMPLQHCNSDIQFSEPCSGCHNCYSDVTQQNVTLNKGCQPLLSLQCQLNWMYLVLVQCHQNIIMFISECLNITRSRFWEPCHYQIYMVSIQREVTLKLEHIALIAFHMFYF